MFYGSNTYFLVFQIFRKEEIEFATIHAEIAGSKCLSETKVLVFLFVLADNIHTVKIWVKCLQGEGSLNQTCSDNANLDGIVV